MVWRTVIKFMWDKPLYFLDRRWYTTGNNGFRREKKTMAIQLLKKISAVDGDMDEYPEAAFLNAGTIDDVIEKAKQLENE